MARAKENPRALWSSDNVAGLGKRTREGAADPRSASAVVGQDGHRSPIIPQSQVGPQGVQGCANEGLNGIIYLFLFFEEGRAAGAGAVLPALPAGEAVLPPAEANLPVFTGAFLAKTAFACKAGVDGCSLANK